MRLRRALPPLAVLVLAIAGTGVATAAPSPVVLEDVQVVSPLGDDWVVGLEVDSMQVTWGAISFDEELAPHISSYGYRPAVADEPLALGTAMTPVIEDAAFAATTDSWAVGLDPTVDVEEGYALHITDRTSGDSATVYLEPTFEADGGSVQLWGDTAVVGNQALNLVTGEVFLLTGPGEATDEEIAAEPWLCLDGSRSAFDHGVLVAYDSCRFAVVTVDVPATGLTTEALDAAAVLVQSHSADLFALSGDGLVAYVDEVAEGVSRLVWQDLRSDAAPSMLDLPEYPVALRADGRRMVVVTAAGENLNSWLVEAEAGLIGPIADLSLLSELAAARIAMLREPFDPSSSMNLDGLSIDLRGRTLAWTTGTEIRIGTLPALSGDASPVLDVPSTVDAGAELTISGSGFLPGEEVLVRLGISDPGVVRTEADGSFSVSVVVPAGATGEQTVIAAGFESGWVAEGAVLVTGRATDPTDPTDPTRPPAPPTTGTPGQNPGLEVQTG